MVGLDVIRVPPFTGRRGAFAGKRARAGRASPYSRLSSRARGGKPWTIPRNGSRRA